MYERVYNHMADNLQDVFIIRHTNVPNCLHHTSIALSEQKYHSPPCQRNVHTLITHKHEEYGNTLSSYSLTFAESEVDFVSVESSYDIAL